LGLGPLGLGLNATQSGREVLRHNTALLLMFFSWVLLKSRISATLLSNESRYYV